MSAPKRIKLDHSVEGIHSILPDELLEETPLETVYIDDIADPKNTSKAIIELNSRLPLPDLNHLKRIKAKSIILFPASKCEKENVHAVLENLGFPVSYLSNNVRVASVAKIPPKVRKQYDVVNRLWPCNFHSDKNLEKLSTNTLFSKSDIARHEKYMKMAIEVSKLVHDRFGIRRSNGVIVVDPAIDSLVAVGYDQLDEGPCQHAVMVAIDNVAKTQNGGVWNRVVSATETTDDALDLRGIESELLKHLTDVFDNFKAGARMFKAKSELEVPSSGPYLCTGYYVYSIQEPCIMCSMALIHSRIKRVFYGLHTNKGGLGTLCKVHTVKDLNHHFEVFAGVLVKDCLQLQLT